MQGRDVLLQGVGLDVLDGLLGEFGAQEVRGGGSLGEREHQIRLRVAQQVIGAGAFLFGSEAHFNHVAHAVHARVADALVAKLRAKVGERRFGALRNGRAHVDLKQEVHAAAKVKAEIHRQRPDRKQPLRGVRGEVQGHHVGGVLTVRVERLFKDLAGLKLLFGLSRLEAYAHGVLLGALFEEDAVGMQVCIAQKILDRLQGLLRHLHRRLAGRDLHCRRLAVEVRQGVDQTDHKGDNDDDVFPERIAVHRMLLRCAAGFFLRRNRCENHLKKVGFENGFKPGRSSGLKKAPRASALSASCTSVRAR